MGGEDEIQFPDECKVRQQERIRANYAIEAPKRNVIVFVVRPDVNSLKNILDFKNSWFNKSE